MDHAGLRAKALAAISGAAWLPAWGEERIASMVANRPDWCISRQRDWGVPLPAFFCKKCEEPLLDPVAIENVEKAFAAGGSNSWYSMEAGAFIVPAPSALRPAAAASSPRAGTSSTSGSSPARRTAS
jgi:isoleucyl-tRNA synthetase